MQVVGPQSPVLRLVSIGWSEVGLVFRPWAWLIQQLG